MTTPHRRPARRRVTIAPGVRRDGDRLVATVRHGTGPNQRSETRIFDLGTDLDRVIKVWQRDAKNKLVTATPTAPGVGTLAADILDFLDALPAGTYRDDSGPLLDAWSRTPIGAVPRHAVDRLDLIAQIARWTDAGAAAATCNRRLSRLRALYTKLDGPTTPNPTDKIPYLAQPEIENREIPPRIVALILDSLPDRGRASRGQARPTVSHSKIRLRVMAHTGIPPATLRRVRPRDLDLDAARIYLRPRRKGHGSPGAWIALLPAAVDALRAFVAAGLIGLRWSNGSMRKTWHVAIARARKTAARIAAETGDRSWMLDLASLPPRCKPYDLRHSFASELYRVTGDIRAVSELLQHAELETTKRYTHGAVSDRVTAAIQAAAAAYATVPTPPAPAPPAPLRLIKRAASA